MQRVEIAMIDLEEAGYRFSGRGTGCEKRYEKDDIEIRLNRCNGIVTAVNSDKEVILKRYFSPHNSKKEITTFLKKLEEIER